MDCYKCLKKCEATCCGPVPFPKRLFKNLVPVRKADLITNIKGNIIAVDEKGYCVFLGEDLKCTVYSQRPEICKRYGDEGHIYLTCPYLSKNNRIRTHRERKKIERNQNREVSDFKKRCYDKHRGEVSV